MASDFIRHQLDAKISDWEERLKQPSILPSHAVAELLSKLDAGGRADDPLWRQYIEDAVSQNRISDRLQIARWHLASGDIEGTAQVIHDIEWPVEVVKNLIASNLPVVNSFSAPHYERGLGTLQAAKDGHTSVHGTEDEKIKKWREQCAAFDQAFAAKKKTTGAQKKTIGEAEREAATICGVSQKSIGRARKKRDQGLLN
ncbi:hypothetical protein LB553_05410 [Mesorhizobium sp. CA8]|uniref:hypothetical protein n=1 Tax=Mesorhizobium sp. CA8 TaxID=2876637 RepID=UPI001CCA7359|nr:hypothetical protein [Mesorhizobium sp. CA8]MBZ9760312.1 hypothetical protein [Mesorhizobium sp. CA8]